MKHLTIKGTVSENHKNVVVSVINQTHFGKEFGVVINGESKPFYTIGNVTLHSSPENDIADPTDLEYFFPSSPSTLYVHGLSDGDCCINVEVPIEYWEGIKQAVLAYNEEFKD